MSFVYVIRSGEYAKIGFSKNPMLRMEHMDASMPVAPTLEAQFPGSVVIERKLHHYFRADHIRREWFRWTPEIEQLCRTGLPDFECDRMADFGFRKSRKTTSVRKSSSPYGSTPSAGYWGHS